VHLVPSLDPKHLDAITTEQVQQLKNRLKARAPKTVNNVLTVLNVMHLSPAAVEGAIRLLDNPSGVFARGDNGETASIENDNSSR
jgi:hypothetical protein